MNSQPDLLYKLAFNFIPNIGAVHAKNLISYCGGIRQVFESNMRTLTKVPGIGEKRAKDILENDALVRAENELDKLSKKDIDIMFYLDETYPQRLRAYHDAPLLLYTRGQMDLNHHRIVSIVGTRKITEYGTIQCERLIDELSAYDCLILSGLAYGVDTCAHRKAVELGTPTVGVLGHGIDQLYPAANRKLASKMMDKGGLISEYPLGTKPDRENFPRRNRVIAGLADAVIVIESAAKGGSMITAEFANEYSKDVFAVPGRISDEFSVGCNHLIKTHKAHLCTSAADIAYINRWDSEAAPRQMTLALELESNEQQVYDLVKTNPNIHLDTLFYKSKIPLADLTSLLLNLEFKGILKSLPGKKYILTH